MSETPKGIEALLRRAAASRYPVDFVIERDDCARGADEVAALRAALWRAICWMHPRTQGPQDDDLVTELCAAYAGPPDSAPAAHSEER